jgi:hypothetical protein
VDIFAQLFLGLFKRCLFLAFFFLTIRRMTQRGLHAKLLNLYIVGLAIYVLFSGSPIFQALSTYFTIVEIGLVGISIVMLVDYKRKVFLIFLFLFGLLQMLSALNPYPDLYIPYLSIFSDVKRWTY